MIVLLRGLTECARTAIAIEWVKPSIGCAKPPSKTGTAVTGAGQVTGDAAGRFALVT
jgi:hypothetical protein